MDYDDILNKIGWNESPCEGESQGADDQTMPSVHMSGGEEEDIQEVPVKKKRGRPLKAERVQQLKTRFGQCGNQLGEQLFSFAFSDAVSSSPTYWNNTCSRDSWFSHNSRGQLNARAVLVDSEAKVVSTLSKKSSTWIFNAGNVVSSNSGGAGNNFAQGYSVTGPCVKDGVLEVLRRESEKCDRVRGVISLGSCAGGTGSGVGTFTLENVRDTFPNKNLVSVLVTPYFSGEVVTQNNNTLFTLAKQNDICDAMVIFENDLISNLVTHHCRLKSSAFPDLNKVIVQNLLSFLQPVKDCAVDLYDFLNFLCPHPTYKLLTIQSFPLIKESKSKFEAPPSWNTVERDMIRFLKASLYSSNIDFIDAVANLVISRGQTVPDATLRKVKSVFFSPSWVPPSSSFQHYHQPRQLLSQEKCVTLISNSASICGLLDSCVSKAWKLFTNNMYVHQYYKFGFTKDHFMEAFVKSEQILKAYKHLK